MTKNAGRAVTRMWSGEEFTLLEAKACLRYQRKAIWTARNALMGRSVKQEF